MRCSLTFLFFLYLSIPPLLYSSGMHIVDPGLKSPRVTSLRLLFFFLPSSSFLARYHQHYPHLSLSPSLVSMQRIQEQRQDSVEMRQHLEEEMARLRYSAEEV